MVNIDQGTDNEGQRHNNNGHDNGCSNTSSSNTSNTSGNGVPAMAPNFNITWAAAL